MSNETRSGHTDERAMLREMLSRLQDEAYQRIRDLRRDQEQESDSEPEDEMDLARTTAEVETHAALIARAEEKLRFLDEALTRLDEGKYGRCLECGMAIPIERLMAIPFASYCVDCQQRRNSASRGWGEGGTIQPYDKQWTVPEEMEQPQERIYRSGDPEEQLTIRYREAAAAREPESKTANQTSRKRTPRRKK